MRRHDSTTQPSPWAIWAALMAIYVIWGSTYLAIAYAVKTMPPFLMAGTRFLTAGLILFGVQRLRGVPAPRPIEWRSAAVVGLFLLFLGNGGVVWAEQRVASGIAALLIASTPLWMVLIDAFRRGGRRPSVGSVLGILAGFGGIALLIGPGQVAGDAHNVDSVGAVVLVLAALVWSIGSLYSRNAPLPAAPLMGTAAEMLVGGGALFLLGILSGELQRLDFAAISTASWLGLGYLIAFGALVGFTAYTWLLRVAPTPLVSTYAYVNPIVAVVAGFFIAGEPLSLRTGIAAAIIVGAVVLTTLKPGARKAPQPASPCPAPDLGQPVLECRPAGD